VERSFLSRDDLLHGLGNLLEKGAVADGVTDEQLAVLQRVKGAPIDKDAFNVLMQQHPGGPAAYLPQALLTYADAGNPSTDALRQMFGSMQGPMNQRTELAHAVNTLAGHPVMAYSAVTAGGAMGTAAALQAYDWWMSQQQQGQKESQLPLSSAPL
jgi:hypothetical protein